METLEIEDLKNLLLAIRLTFYNNIISDEKERSLNKSRAVIEQLIKDKEFEQSRNPLPY